MFRTTAILAFLAAAASAAPAPPAKAPLLWAGLEPGPLSVGFKSWDMRLQAADFDRGPQHLIQMDVWYPIIAGTGTAMTFKDYVIPKFTETHYADPSDEDRAAMVADFRSSAATLGIPAAAADRWLDSPVYARMNGTPPMNRKYPIIGIAPDAGQSLPEQAILGEYLASFGYVVVTTASMTRFDPLTPEKTMQLQEEQQDDLDRIVGQIGYWPMTVHIPVTIIGFGFGADAAVLYAMHPKQPTNALVLVDPQFTDDRIASMKRSAMFDAPHRFPTILELHAGKADLSFLRTLDTKELVPQPEPMRHLEFTSMGFAAAAIPDIAKATGAGRHVGKNVRGAAQSIRTFIERIWAPARPPI